MREQWVKIDGFPGYEVSSHGRVGSWLPLGGRGAPPVERRVLKGCTRRRSSGASVNVHVILMSEGRQYTRLVHHLVLGAFGTVREHGQVCRHLDGAATNNHITNLTWGSPLENQHDRRKHGTSGQKLSTVDVDTIRRRHAAGESQTKIADSYGVSQVAISCIITGKSWSWHVTKPG